MDLDDLVDITTLLVSELATNAIHASVQAALQAAAPRAERIALRLTATPANLVIEMWDSAPTLPVRQAHDLTAENGRGLLLVETLSRDTGVYFPRTGGKVLWVALALGQHSFQGDRTVSEDPLPHRDSPSCPEPSEPVALVDDIALLRRVIDRLRALDGWHPSAGVQPAKSGAPAAEAARTARDLIGWPHDRGTSPSRSASRDMASGPREVCR
jgi:Histidine kinase-like ATPase domain